MAKQLDKQQAEWIKHYLKYQHHVEKLEQERLLRQFREFYMHHPFSESSQAYETQKRPKQYVKKVLYPATAAAVAAMIMTPSVVAFAERGDGEVIPGEKLPVQVQTENSAIEQPADTQPQLDQRSVPHHPVVPRERSDVPKVRSEVGGEKAEHHKKREHRKERFYESREQEQTEPRVAPKSNETITTPSNPETQSEPATQPQPSSSVSQPKQQPRPKDENHHQEPSHPQVKPESSAAVQSDTEQMSAAHQEQQDQPTASTSQAAKAKLSAPTLAAIQGQVQDQPTASDQPTAPASQTAEAGKVSTETPATQPGSAAPAPQIEVKGKLPETASPYPIQMLSSLGIAVAGLIGLKWSKRKNPR